MKIIGRGFIAEALKKHDLPDAVFYMGGVSSNTLITPEAVRRQMNEWLDVVELCSRQNAYLVYASSATASTKETPYARLKAAMELLAPQNSLGIRLPAVYGPGEAHKGKAASVVYQWTQEMRQGERPTIWGDGTQTRDFMYIDDVADAIVLFAERRSTGLQSIGTGVATSFNEVVETINTVLGSNLEPHYLPKPTQYVEAIEGEAVPYKVLLAEGIRRIVNDTK